MSLMHHRLTNVPAGKEASSTIDTGAYRSSRAQNNDKEQRPYDWNDLLEWWGLINETFGAAMVVIIKINLMAHSFHETGLL